MATDATLSAAPFRRGHPRGVAASGWPNRRYASIANRGRRRLHCGTHTHASAGLSTAPQGPRTSKQGTRTPSGEPFDPPLGSSFSGAWNVWSYVPDLNSDDSVLRPRSHRLGRLGPASTFSRPSNRDRRESEHACQSRCRLHVAVAERLSDVIEPIGILEREIWGPPFIRIQEFHVDLGHVAPLMHSLRTRSGVHLFLLRKSASQRLGSGRYAVTSTAGDEFPLGMPHTT